MGGRPGYRRRGVQPVQCPMRGRRGRVVFSARVAVRRGVARGHRPGRLVARAPGGPRHRGPGGPDRRRGRGGYPPVGVRPVPVRLRRRRPVVRPSGGRRRPPGRATTRRHRRRGGGPVGRRAGHLNRVAGRPRGRDRRRGRRVDHRAGRGGRRPIRSSHPAGAPRPGPHLVFPSRTGDLPDHGGRSGPCRHLPAHQPRPRGSGRRAPPAVGVGPRWPHRLGPHPAAVGRCLLDQPGIRGGRRRLPGFHRLRTGVPAPSARRMGDPGR